MKFQNLIRARNNDKKKSIRNVYNNIVFMEGNFKDLEYLNISTVSFLILYLWKRISKIWNI